MNYLSLNGAGYKNIQVAPLM